MSGLKTREAILSKTTRRYATIELPEVGEVRVRSLTERERSICELKAVEDTQNFRATLIAMTLVDEDGDRLFTDSDVVTIGEIDSAVTGAIVTKIEEHCQVIGPSVEDEVKN